MTAVSPLLPSQFWSLSIGVYLFLGGLAGGAYVTGTVADFLSVRDPSRREGHLATARWGTIMGLVALAIGGPILLFHLGEPLHVIMIWLFTNFDSWMTIGVWVIVLFMVLSALQALWLGFGADRGFEIPITALEPVTDIIDTVADLTRPSETLRRGINAFGAVVGLLLIVYTALLLSASSNVVPMWDATWLPPLFLASGLSMGIAATVGVTAVTKGVTDTGVTMFSVADDVIIVAEMVVIYMLLATLVNGNTTAVETQRYLLTEGNLIFWGGVVALGLLLPLAISVGLLTIEWRYELHDNPRLERLATAGYTAKFGFVIFGGLMLRLTIIYAALNVPLFGV
ncbi:NrfD/PsrC family molybdoenzyme membrane anchor subunit [Halapricum hydrolyticum]|uniref:Polysulfide reductase NrfD n=1 Tax=Halapricum hydrolyticum TaxID=2979991 RepID=A0AAE3I9W4_9EURY|nr:NrfD/PsrC family molybdoenzyme membrane anchor subunit [Halapricum hydrolyticum]MCU4717419.1 polysulfide reductase NrfD [Halapricum hydrolyticum]MCU4726583.1 polysulfide reductase NrfD [Halapricum hydrolyticum]